MPQYLLSVHGNEEIYNFVSPENRQKMYEQVDGFNTEVFRSGSWVFGGGLELANTATVVTSKDGKTTTTDGPYLETKEHIGGFWIINARDLDAALVWAEKASAACMSPVEVRAFQPMPGE
ncbi:MAG: YciI family protein [Ilumatobacteraceae bacterium]